MSGSDARRIDDWRETEAYAGALAALQLGKWAEALTALEPMLETYSDQAELRQLVEQTRARQISEQKGGVRSRTLLVRARRVIFALLLVIALVLLAFALQRIYTGFVMPSLAQTRAATQQESLLTQASRALAAGNYDDALDLFGQLAELNPDYPGLSEGVAAATQARELESAYQTAQAQMAAGEFAAAQATLIGIQQEAPNYRAVADLLAQIENRNQLNSLLRQVEEAKAAGDLEGLMVRLEAARRISPRDERTQLEDTLFSTYITLANQAVENSAGQVDELRRADDLLGKALSLRPQAPAATVPRDRLRRYLDGYSAFAAGRWERAIVQLELVYTEQPGYLDGLATQLLYNAYMRIAERYHADGEIALAWERYYRASQLQGIDTSTARALAASLAQSMTPTPTATPTLAPTVPATPTPAPTATATPGYVPLSRYRGKIVYYSNQAGSAELWIMDPDGSHKFRIWNQGLAAAEYQRLQKAEMRSPDGLNWLYVTTPRNSQNAQIYIGYPDGTSFQVTEWGGQNYDPVWSPKGHWLAFVATDTGNDEIFLIGADGEHPKRLTWNDWEWDKHPSWDPEGGRLVFWSNRVTGYQQIWLMNEDGSYPVNLSNSKYEEWDPIWIK